MKLLAGAVSALATAAALAQVDVRLERFGAGDAFRPGDWTAIQVTVTNELTEPTQIRLQWDIPDANGDITENSRTLFLTPGQPATRWLYGRLPPAPSADRLDMAEAVTLVRVFEEKDGRRTRELRTARILPSVSANKAIPVDIKDDLIGIIGGGRMGFDGYERAFQGTDFIPSQQTVTRITRNINPRDLPDRWEGLESFRALAWSDAQPSLLGLEAGEALKAWVRHGGNLIISLPEAGNPWGLGGGTANPLSDLLPSQQPQRLDAVPIETLLPVVSKTRNLRNTKASTPLSIFAAEKLDRGYEPLIALPCPDVDAAKGTLKPRAGTLDGAIIAVQRRYGHGRITVVGLDVDALERRRLQAEDVPQADIFWNRIIGQRGDTPGLSEYMALEQAEPRRLVRNISGNNFEIPSELISNRIGLQGQAALGILGMLFLFGAYWAVAGPVSWVVLGRMRMQRHSWLVFVAIAAVFTVVAWGSGRLLTNQSVRVRHVTVLDYIARGPGEPASEEPRWARATTWFSASLPGYGRVPVAVGGKDERNLLGIWSPPPSGSGQRFPNASRYEVPLDSPGSFTVPARATAAEFEARWMGTLDSSWGTLPASDGPAPISATISFVAGTDPRVMVRGTLVHQLPGTLDNVRILHIGPFRSDLPRMEPVTVKATQGNPQDRRPVDIVAPSARLPNGGKFVKLTTSWGPGVPLELSNLLFRDGPEIEDPARSSLATHLHESYYRPIADAQFGTRPFTGSGDGGAYSMFDLLSFYSMLEPPAYMENVDPAGNARDPAVGRALRCFGRGLDLGQWFTRPAIIIEGFLQDSPCPVPLEIDGRKPESEGLTVVRIVIPLPLEAECVPANVPWILP